MMSKNELDQIAVQLKSREVKARVRAIRALREIGEPEILDLLLNAAIRDDDFQVSGEAAQALKEFSEKASFKGPLLERLGGTGGPREKGFIASLLRNHRDEDVINALLAASEQNPDNLQLLECAAWSLSNFDLDRAKAYFRREKINIVVAEDETDIRDLICFTLRFAGWSAMGAIDGEGAVAFTRICEPDLVLLDVRMPRLNGYDACRLLKNNPMTRHIPVVFLSAKGQESEINAGLDAGAEEYLLKPFGPDQLTEHVKAILAKFRLGIYED